MKNLLIIGARGFGREIYNSALESIGYNDSFIVKGFLDDKVNALDGYDGYPPIVDSVEHYQLAKDDVFICALGEVSYKETYVKMILAKGGEFINLIHKTANVDRNTVLGKGCIVCRNVQISCDIQIGNYVTFQPFSIIGHDASIGNFCHLNTYAFVGGYSVLSDGVTMHTGAMLHPYKCIGEYSIIGAGAFVISNVKPNTTMIGNPARTLKL